MSDNEKEVELIWASTRSPLVVHRMKVRCDDRAAIRKFVIGIVNTSNLPADTAGITYIQGGLEQMTNNWNQVGLCLIEGDFLKDEGTYVLIIKSTWTDLSGLYLFQGSNRKLTVLYHGLDTGTDFGRTIVAYYNAMGVPMPV